MQMRHDKGTLIPANGWMHGSLDGDYILWEYVIAWLFLDGCVAPVLVSGTVIEEVQVYRRPDGTYDFGDDCSTAGYSEKDVIERLKQMEMERQRIDLAFRVVGKDDRAN